MTNRRIISLVVARPCGRVVFVVTRPDGDLMASERRGTAVELSYQATSADRCGHRHGESYRVFSGVNGGCVQESDLFEGLR